MRRGICTIRLSFQHFFKVSVPEEEILGAISFNPSNGQIGEQVVNFGNLTGLERQRRRSSEWHVNEEKISLGIVPHGARQLREEKTPIKQDGAEKSDLWRMLRKHVL